MAIKNTPPEPDLPNIRKPPQARPLWRLFGWGGAASIALAAVALTSQTDTGGKRLQLALANAREPMHAVAQIPPRAADAAAEAETKRLAAQVRELAADRERLSARIAMLERNLEDMTGSIKQQSEQLAAARAAAMTPPPAPSAPATAPVAAAAPPQAAKSAAEQVPLPPVRVAKAPANEPAAEPPPPAKDEFGIDLGGAHSIEALRIHWAALKANYGPLLVGLHPLAMQYPRHPSGVAYRLVVGPLPDAAEAAHLCARFPTLRTGCHPAKFIGAQLAAY